MVHLPRNLCNYEVDRLKVEHLPAGRQVTEREKKSIRCQTACCPNPFSLGLKRFDDLSKEFLFGQQPGRKMKI